MGNKTNQPHPDCPACNGHGELYEFTPSGETVIHLCAYCASLHQEEAELDKGATDG